MSDDLAIRLERERDVLLEAWSHAAADADQREVQQQEFVRFGTALVDELLRFLHRGDPRPLGAFGATEGGRLVQQGIELGKAMLAVRTLREAALDRLEGSEVDPAARYGAARRLLSAIDVVLDELVTQFQHAFAQRLGMPGTAQDVLGHLDREIRRAQRFHRPLAVLLIAVDRYDEYMGLYGGTLGELTMSAVGGVLGRLTREVDIKVTVEGGEFALILPETSLDDARWVAERIRAGVETGDLADEFQLLVTDLTVSIGVANLPPDGSTPQELLDAAHQALTQAVRLGRNAVVVHDWVRPGQHVS